MINFTIRASELALIMSESKAKTSTKSHKVKTESGEIIVIKQTDESTKAKDVLSEGAKTHIETMARKHVYQYESCINSKYLDKGIWVENEVIQLYNDVFFCNAVKNTERKILEVAPGCFLTGECDFQDEQTKKITDIKSSWSIETFPETKKVAIKDACKAGYDWQGRAYMMLWNYDLFEIAYGIVDTPEELLYESQLLDDKFMSAHRVSHIDKVLRITAIEFKRDLALEEKIKEKIKHAYVYFNRVVEEILSDHK